MSKIRNEVLESNRKYAALAIRVNWAFLRPAGSPFSPAWTRGSIPPSMRALPKEMRT